MCELDGFMRRIKKVDKFIELFFPMGPYHNVVTKETTSKHKSTKLSMSHVKTLSTINTRNPTIVQYLSLPTTQVFQILIISLKNIILSLRPPIAAKMLLEIHLFLPTAALATFAIPSYVLKLKHPKLHILLHQK